MGLLSVAAVALDRWAWPVNLAEQLGERCVLWHAADCFGFSVKLAVGFRQVGFFLS